MKPFSYNTCAGNVSGNVFYLLRINWKEVACVEIYTIRDIAQKAGVGVSTVSRVLNGHPDVSEETRKRVMDIVNSCGFVQNDNARFLKRSRTAFAAIIVRGRRNVFLTGLAEQMLAIAQGSKIPFLIEYIDEADDEFDAMRKLYAERAARGFIILGSRLDERAETVKNLGVPCVFATVDAAASGLDNASSVSIDDRAASRAMAQELISLGHRRIAVFGGCPDGNDPFVWRYRGVLDTLTAHGIAFDSSQDYVKTRFTLDGAYESAERYFSVPRSVTAVMCMSDTIAAGVIRALKDKGLCVPQDISVTGFDGTQMARFYIPSIATVRQPTELIARESVDLLHSMLDGQQAQCLKVGFELIMGESLASVRT